MSSSLISGRFLSLFAHKILQRTINNSINKIKKEKGIYSPFNNELSTLILFFKNYKN